MASYEERFPDANTPEIMRRLSYKTTAHFDRSDRVTSSQQFRAEPYERVLDFCDCGSITFRKSPSGRDFQPTDLLLMLQKERGQPTTGNLIVPAGVEVLVTRGFARCTPVGPDAPSTVVGAQGSMGRRAPPPSCVDSYAGSRYSGARYVAPSVSHVSRREPSMSPPHDAASFSRGAQSYYSSARSRGPSAAFDDFEVEEQMPDFDQRVAQCGYAASRGPSRRDFYDDVSPDDSISNVDVRDDYDDERYSGPGRFHQG